MLFVSAFKGMLEVEGYWPKKMFNVDETGPPSTALSLHIWP
jgi:hypothetical protein